MPDSSPKVNSADTTSKRDPSPASQSKLQESEEQPNKEDPDSKTNATIVQKPVDLYKVPKFSIWYNSLLTC